MQTDELFLNSNLDSHTQELELLQKLGFPINPYNIVVKGIDNVWLEAEKIHTTRDQLPYQIDGMVVKINNNIAAKNLGVVGKTARAWCAIKFEAEETTTRLTGILWQVGRTGRITPVAELEPVELAGSVVKRATLHNAKEVLEKAPRANDTVIIRKAGDVIPEILAILENLREQEQPALYDLPTHCPSCNTRLRMSLTNVDLYCPNTANCPDQIKLRLVYYCQRSIANITGLSDKLIEKFMEKFDIHDIYDLYNLPYEDIFELEGFGQKSVENLRSSVDKSKDIVDYKFLAGLGIDGVGPEVAKLICEKIQEKQSRTS